MVASDTQTSTGVVIVAVPAPMDPIRLVGDEEKHATILFFGDKSTLPTDAKKILSETIQNVTRLFMPFGESVVDISRLGSDTPPALVAMLNGACLSKIRDALLINPAVGEYLSNATQYPQYTPHVTLGYPDYQGEAELRKIAQNLYRVRFDRLSLWWGAERIDFSLDAALADAEMAQSVTLADAEDYLAHFGVKGMKWGVRKDHFGVGGIDLATGQQVGTSVTRAKSKTAVDASFKANSADTYKVLGTIHKHLGSRAAEDAYNAKIAKLYPKGQKFDVNVYRAKASQALSEVMKEHLASKKITGVEVKTMPLGPNQFQYIIGDKKTVAAALGDIHMTKLAHDDIGEGAVKFTVTFLWNDDGTPNGYSLGTSEMAHADDIVEDFLAHHGVKGMKWGVKRELTTAGGQAKVALSNKKVKAALTATRVAMTSPQVRQEAAQAGKTAFTIGRYGIAPLAAATGIGIPAVAGLGISVKILSDPAVQAAVASAGKYAAGVAKQVGPTALSAVKQVKKIDVSKIVSIKTVNGPNIIKTGGPYSMIRDKNGHMVPNLSKSARTVLTSKGGIPAIPR